MGVLRRTVCRLEGLVANQPTQLLRRIQPFLAVFVVNLTNVRIEYFLNSTEPCVERERFLFGLCRLTTGLQDLPHHLDRRNVLTQLGHLSTGFDCFDCGRRESEASVGQQVALLRRSGFGLFWKVELRLRLRCIFNGLRRPFGHLSFNNGFSRAVRPDHGIDEVDQALLRPRIRRRLKFNQLSSVGSSISNALVIASLRSIFLSSNSSIRSLIFSNWPS